MQQEGSLKLLELVLYVLTTLLGLERAQKKQFQESWGDYARALSAVLLFLVLAQVKLALGFATHRSRCSHQEMSYLLPARSATLFARLGCMLVLSRGPDS